MKLPNWLNKALGRKAPIERIQGHRALKFRHASFAVVGPHEEACEDEDFHKIQGALDQIGEGVSDLLDHDDKHVRFMALEVLIAIVGTTIGPLARSDEEMEIVLNKIEETLRGSREAFNKANPEEAARQDSANHTRH